jgi:hypothetical protein
MKCAARYDDSNTGSELGLAPRPLRDTLTDTVRWLVDSGHLSAPKQASSRVRPR